MIILSSFIVPSKFVILVLLISTAIQVLNQFNKKENFTSRFLLTLKFDHHDNALQKRFNTLNGLINRLKQENMIFNTFHAHGASKACGHVSALNNCLLNISTSFCKSINSISFFLIYKKIHTKFYLLQNKPKSICFELNYYYMKAG